MITQSREIFNHRDACVFPFFFGSRISDYYLLRRKACRVVQRDRATQNKSFVVSSVLIATGERREERGRGERQASRPAHHRLRVSRETASYAVIAH